MKTIPHTPGPWKTERCHLGQWIKAGESFICPLPDHIEHEGRPCGSVASQDKTQAEIDANARLIAAAPSILSALQACLDSMERRGFHGITRGGHSEEQDWNQAVRAARAVIEAATTSQ